MKILLTGATGYIGKRLLPILLENGHHVVCCVRDKERFNPPKSLAQHISIIEIDLLESSTLKNIPNDIDIAYYLVHSMSSTNDYRVLEQKSAINFRQALRSTSVKQVIYLSGIVNEKELSEHLLSRRNVEKELEKGQYHFTCLRAGIIIGSGSASFEIIRDLVEKLPFMITPKWLQTRCQPIGISDVILFLTKCMLEERTFNRNFDIGCDDILTYREMLLGFAKVRNLKRIIWTVPVMTPKLSSYWLYFVTSTSYNLATSLVESMKVEVVCRNTELNEILDVHPISYVDCLNKAFSKIEKGDIDSSWKDAYQSSGMGIHISDHMVVPEHGCFNDKRNAKIKDIESCKERIWSIGGKNGWYYANWLWKTRGFLDKLFGGVGLRRGRTNQHTLAAGDALDFWRVLYSDKEEGRLLLYAEMKLPGEAWLEFRLEGNKLTQIATFRPLGLTGRLYWYAVYPLHELIFGGLIRKLTEVTN
ncbi:SDR family oxidoreductase [Ulvibacterium marinum]|uniref:SDR family oxidoreductase n=1 Tax=Ulvibacterium marinum TaxID=2419782 RepID=A0A3B0C1K9_9FLAO|nr:SDR family oxidoreductase [Ulvibacterium marinum]RKN78711.1 SDR family oxidoreductase [Ulvibacterium marinum]